MIKVYIFLKLSENAQGMQIRLNYWAGYDHKVSMARLRRAWKQIILEPPPRMALNLDSITVPRRGYRPTN